MENQPPAGGAGGDRRAKHSSGTSNGVAPDAGNPMKLTLTDIDFHLTPVRVKHFITVPLFLLYHVYRLPRVNVFVPQNINY